MFLSLFVALPRFMPISLAVKTFMAHFTFSLNVSFLLTVIAYQFRHFRAEAFGVALLFAVEADIITVFLANFRVVALFATFEAYLVGVSYAIVDSFMVGLLLFLKQIFQVIFWSNFRLVGAFESSVTLFITVITLLNLPSKLSKLCVITMGK